MATAAAAIIRLNKATVFIIYEFCVVVAVKARHREHVAVRKTGAVSLRRRIGEMSHHCYPLKSTPSNASEGTSLVEHLRASLPVAIRCCQRSRKLPVISISLTGRTATPLRNSCPEMP